MATSETSIQPSTHDSTFRPPNWKQITESVFEVYKPETGGFNLEIVFVHGVRTSSSDAAYYRTWMKGDDSGSWLDTWLVECFPRARIISVSYDSSLIKSDTSGHQDMYLIGESLVQCLVQLAGVGQRCPVVLVGHCVGGLVLKHICLWAHKFATREIECGMPRQSYVNFLKYVKGAFFYSTPNLGSDLPLKAESDEDAPLRRYLEVFHPDLGRSNEDFTKLRRQYGWRTFGLGATNKTWKRKRENIQSSNNEMDDMPTSFLAVEEGSARVDMDEFCSIARVDHSSICKPSSQESLSFSLLRNFVETFASLQEELEVELQRSLGLHFSITNLDHRLDKVIEKLQIEKAEQIHLALVGMDGIGKSTLAKQVLVSIGHQFDYTCFVEFDEVPAREKSRELERLVGENLRHQNGERVRLREGEKPWNTLRRKKVLIMVDDVESDDQISSLLIPGWCGEGSRLLITSSRQNWTQYFIVHPIPPLSQKAALELFECHVGESVLKSISKFLVSQVLDECEGLPLTLEVLGKYLRGETRDSIWVGALKRLETADSLDGEHNSNRVWQKLKVSFENLAEIEKNIFLDIATFDSHGLSAPQYNLKVWKCAWHTKWEEADVDLGLVNLARRSFLRIHGGVHQQNIMNWQLLSHSSTVGVHKQLRNMGKWISAPANEAPSKWRGLWRLKDVKEMLMSHIKDVSKMEAQLRDNPQTEVLSISMEERSSYFENSNFQDARSAVQWSSIGMLEKLRLLRISNMRMTGGESELRLPRNLTLLDMENCKREWMTSNSERMWNVIGHFWPIWNVENHSWPICEEDVERLHSLSVVILKKCNIVQLPKNVHGLGRLKILRITTDGMSMMPLPNRFGLLPALEHLYLSAPLENLPSSLWQLSSLQSMVLNGLYFQAFPNPITGNHLTALTSLELIDLHALAELPDSFGGLASLQRLRVEGCSALKNIPEGFGTLHRLELLQISHCRKLETLCDSFSGLRRLQSLSLENLPQLRALPTRFGYLPCLENFRLSVCDLLKELPESFIELTSIRVVRLEWCGLESLWSNIRHIGVESGLKKLSRLEINYCPELRSLPSSLGQLSSLTDLNVRDCEKLRNVEESVWDLTSLRELVLEYGVKEVANEDGSGRSVLPSFGQLSGQYDIPKSISGTLQASDGENTSSESFNCKMAVRVPHPIAQLRALKCLRVSNYPRLFWLLQSIGYLTSLTHLGLHSCGDLVTIPGAIGGLSSLEVFKISDCENLVGLTESIWQLPKLNFLHIEKCGLVNLPESTGQLSCLSHLEIEDCEKLVNLPESIGQLSCLYSLKILKCGNLVNLPTSMGQLSCLNALRIVKCGNLVNLPESMGQLSCLNALSIQKCGNLVNLPESIGQLSCLNELCILKCGNLVNLPESIGQLSCLTHLEIEDCENLVNLPESIGQLSCLYELRIVKCGNLVNLPESIGQLSYLCHLEIEDCENLLNLPESIGELSYLYNLRILKWGNLVDLPESIGQLSCLSHLEIEDCENLVNLPESIGQLSCLNELMILKCGNLVNLPASIGQLSCLSDLKIEDCESLLNLPESIGQLSCLSYLKIANCGLMHFPKSMENLTSLRKLYISECKKLVTVPDFLFQMTTLEELHVLDSKPFERMIGKSVQLKRLTSLGLSIWNDLSPLLQSFEQISSTIRTLVIKCMVCENLVESELVYRILVDETREEFLDRVDDRCGCKHVLPLLKFVENYLLIRNPFRICVTYGLGYLLYCKHEMFCIRGIYQTKISETVSHRTNSLTVSFLDRYGF